MENKTVALTNFPNGISSFGMPVYGTAAGDGQLLTGNTYFVNTVSGVDAGAGTSPNAPYQTLTYALTQVTANNNDRIYILPGSTITISSATSLLLNVAGITIVGLGIGNNRPLFNFTTAATASIPVSAANITVQNCRFSASFLSITAAFTVTATGFVLDNCRIFDVSGILNFLNVVNATGAANTADGLTVSNCVVSGLGTTLVGSIILTSNDVDNCTIFNNLTVQATTVDRAIAIRVAAGILTNFSCSYNRCYRNNTTTANGSLVQVLSGTTSTGFVNNNYVQTLTTTADNLFTTTIGLAAFANFVTGVKGASGFLIPTADS